MILFLHSNATMDSFVLLLSVRYLVVAKYIVTYRHKQGA